MEAAGRNVLVKPDTVDNRSAGGIIIEQDAPPVGEVICAGPEADRFSYGQRVLFRKYAGTSVKIDGADFLVLDRADVLVVLDEDQKVE